MFGVVGRHKLAFTGASLGLAGAAYGGLQGWDESEGQGFRARRGMAAHQAAILGLTAAGLGAAGYAGRDLVKKAGLGSVKGAASWYGRGWGAAMHDRSIGAFLSHGPVALTLGGLAGGAIASQLSDDPSQIALGAGIGMATMAVGVPMARQVVSDWKTLGPLGRNGVLAGVTVGAAVAARAYMHEPEYESENHTVNDGVGGYETAPGLRDRLNAMQGSGDIVLGLHNQRH